jgi:hypothetical protein
VTSSAEAIAHAAKGSRTAADVLAELAVHPEWSIRATVARNPSTPPDVLAHLADEEQLELVRADAASNRYTPERALLALARDPAEYLRLRVAANPNATANVLRALTVERAVSAVDPYMLVVVAEHHAAPADVLDALANVGSAEVATAVARHPHASPAALAGLAGHDETSVRRAVAGNPTTPTDVLLRLAADPYDQVRKMVARRSDIDDNMRTLLALAGSAHANP